jgi:hypothetical protein
LICRCSACGEYYDTRFPVLKLHASGACRTLFNIGGALVAPVVGASNSHHGDCKMYVYRKESEGSFAVGYFDPNGEWKVASRHNTRNAAQRRVNYLNGGTGGSPPPVNDSVTGGRDS